MNKVFILFLIVSVVYPENYDKENDVYILNTDNFDEIIPSNKPMLINFYAPWCQFCQKLKPHFERVAQDFNKQNVNVKLGKVDAILETELAKRYNIKRYPTLIFFKEDRQIYYNKSNNYVTISNWLISKTDNLILKLTSKEDYEAMIMKNEVALTVDEFKNLERLDLVAEIIDDIQIAISKSDLFASLFPSYPGATMIITRKADMVTVPFYGSISGEEIKRFTMLNDLPPVVTFSLDNGAKLFSNPYKPLHFLVFVADNIDTTTAALDKVAAHHIETRFAIIDVSQNVSDNIVAFFKVDRDAVPYMVLSDTQGKKTFKPDFLDIDGDKIDKFVTDVKGGKVAPFLRSQPVPENWDSEPLKVLVGKNFEEVAYDKSKHVFIEFYAPWCTHCKQLAPIWENLAKSLVHVPDLIIAKLDKTENDIKGLEITAFPTIKLFLKDTNEVVSYTGIRTKNAFVDFLSKYTDVKENKSEL